MEQLPQCRTADLALAKGLRYFDRTGDRPGQLGPIVFIHGLGNSLDNFIGLAAEPALDDYRLIAFDQPGCGETPYDPARLLNIDGLVELFASFVDRLQLDRFLLVGASLGGLVALLYAERYPARVVGFVDVEGNLAQEDCMHSRLVVPYDYPQFVSEVLPKIRQMVTRFPRYLTVLEQADPSAYYNYCFQLVEYSDRGDLLERFLALPMPITFVYGEENRHLSYLHRLRASHCRVIEIPAASHFLYYDDPRAFAEALRYPL